MAATSTAHMSAAKERFHPWLKPRRKRRSGSGSLENILPGRLLIKGTGKENKPAESGFFCGNACKACDTNCL